MQSKEDAIKAQGQYVLRNTNLGFLEDRYEGKVRDTYRGKKLRYLITTDRISCFDVVLGAVPFKGQVLNQLAEFWFDKTADLVENHVVACPDPNVMAVREVEILPIEVVLRAYLAGSAWRDYEAGRPISGITLPKGMRKHQRLEQVVVTPSTKAERGLHDEPISESALLERELVSPEIWEEVKEKALKLFSFATEEVASRGLLLVDTKYEFGLLDGKVVLADEIHTLDSSRYWVEDSYSERFHSGQDPQMLDKEPVRQWLIARGFMGQGEPPALPEEYISELSLHYMSAFEKISGQSFLPIVGDSESRIANNIREFEEAFS